MKKSRNMVKRFTLMLFASALVCLSPSAYAQGGKQITLSQEQYQTLKQTILEQDKTLDTLESNLSRQQSRRQERSKQLQQLSKQLDKSKAEMAKTQQTLQNASESLEQADKLLKRQAESLQILTEQIKREEHKKAIIKRQRDMYAVLALLAVGGAVVK